jgi:uncharacterized protein
MILSIKARPNSHPVGIEKESEERWIVRIKESPENGKANEAVIKLVAKELKIPKSKIKILKGNTSREKLLKIED